MAHIIHPIYRIFEQIDVLVTPSINYENYPFVLHESLIHEVPVIASDSAG